MGIINYYLGNYRTAMFSMFVAGFILSAIISKISH
jgi:hypothetical protein